MPKIAYYLLKNPIGAQASYRPVAVPREGAFDDFVAALAQRAGQSPETVRAVLLHVGAALGERSAQGFSTDWPDFALFKPLIAGGTVPTPDAPLPPTTRGDVTILARGAFKSALDAAQTERIAPPATAPEWQNVSAENGLLSALSDRTVLKIVGRNLDFDASRADEGLFLRAMSDNTLFKAIATRHTTQKIDALAPSGLTAGAAYALELHTRGAHGAASHELEVYVWPGTVTAA